MKAILVIDEMPMNCSECPLRMEYDYESGECFNGCEIKLNSKPDWCPLKPLPKKKWEWVDAEDTIWNKGWNDCLEELEDK